ncbi:MAG TPA: GtrA family protein [Polyangiaceae bacterium]|nr:GtrA family protein [Polyangiaceae bacterium]
MQSALTVLLVVPCCEAAEAFDAAALERSLERMPNVRFSFVDDGSISGRAEALQRIAAAAPSAARVVQLEPCDRAEATRQGLLLALAENADYFGYCDLALVTCEAIAELVRALMEAEALDIVLGASVASSDRQPDRWRLRSHLWRVLARTASLVLAFPIHDIQAGACLFRAGPRTRVLFAERFGSRMLGVEVMARYLAGAGTRDRVRRVALPCRTGADAPPLEALDFARSLGELANIYRSHDLRQSFRPVVLAVTGVFSRYVGVGGIGTGAHYALLVTSVEWLGLAPQFGAVLGASVGAIVNYFLNYTLTFASREAHQRALPKFALVALAGVLVSGFGVRTAGSWGIHYLWAQILCTLLVLIGGFFVNRAWTFAAGSRETGSKARS